MKSSLKEQFGPRVQVKDIARVRKGTRVRLCIGVSTGQDHAPNMPGAALALARRHMPLSRAHRVLTRLATEGGDEVVEVPKVEDTEALIRELAGCGLTAEVADPPAELDVKLVREKTGYTQEQFAVVYGLDGRTLQNWEQRRTRPGQAERTYLMMIAVDPKGMRERRLAAVKAVSHEPELEMLVSG